MNVIAILFWFHYISFNWQSHHSVVIMSVSNYRHLECLLNRLFRRRSKKASKLCVTGLCEGNSPATGKFPTQRASNAENISIWWRHHESSLFQVDPPGTPQIMIIFQYLWHCNFKQKRKTSGHSFRWAITLFYYHTLCVDRHIVDSINGATEYRRQNQAWAGSIMCLSTENVWWLTRSVLGPL